MDTDGVERTHDFQHETKPRPVRSFGATIMSIVILGVLFLIFGIIPYFGDMLIRFKRNRERKRDLREGRHPQPHYWWSG